MTRREDTVVREIFEMKYFQNFMGHEFKPTLIFDENHLVVLYKYFNFITIFRRKTQQCQK
jgi:hypothetical protein